MKLADFNRLKKLMTLTFSDNDPEAVGALRAANAILTKESLTWDRVLDRVVQILPEVEDAPEPYTSNAPQPQRSQYNRGEESEIEAAFEALDGADLGDFEDFIKSLRRQWREKRSLSPKQRVILFKSAARERDR